MSITLEQGAEEAVTKALEDGMQNTINYIIDQLRQAGEQAVKVARSVATKNGWIGSGVPYKVQTRNLTSSIGYCIVADGRIIEMSSFEALKGTDEETGKPYDGTEGSLDGKKYIKDLAAHYPQGYALILVAGMNYASYVQELHHRDVLNSAELIATELVNKLQAKLRK